jgi:hypothetical protein
MAFTDLVKLSSSACGSCVATSPCDDQRSVFASSAGASISAAKISIVRANIRLLPMVAVLYRPA